MPRFSNAKDTLIEINNMSLQAGNRYRESGLVRGHQVAVGLSNLNGGFGEITAYGYRQIQDLRISPSLTRQYPQS